MHSNKSKGKLRKELGLIDVFAIAAGSMISSGLFILPSIVYREAGPSIVLAYLLAGLFMIPSIMSKAELSTAMPKAGGTYFYVERILGGFWGTLGGFANWFSIALKSAFALIGIGVFLDVIFPGFDYRVVKLIAVIFCIVFTIVNLRSVKTSGRTQVILVAGLILSLGIYVLLGWIHAEPHRFTPFMTGGLKALFATAGMVFISYGGVTKIASIAEETKNPKRTIPYGMFLAFFVVNILYVTVVAVTIGVLDIKELTTSLTPISHSALKFMGRGGEVLMAVAGLAAFITTANAGILSASRVPLAMSRDNLLPDIFSSLHDKYKTPKNSILATSLFMILLIVALDLKTLVKVASTFMLILFILVNFALIVVRMSKLPYYRPGYKAPLFPYMQIGGILIYSLLVFEMGRVPVILTFLFILLILIYYLTYAKKRITRQSALMMLIRKAAATEFVADKNFEAELIQILRERDEITEDRFDKLIKTATFLDIEGPMDMQEFYKIVAGIIAKDSGDDEKVIYDLLLEREKLHSTIVHPGIAIPHIILPGLKKFIIIPVRCRKGIIHSTSQDPVKIAFVLAGTMDERNFHLKALMAIAQIIQDESFEKKWFDARNIEELRSILLFSGRKR